MTPSFIARDMPETRPQLQAGFPRKKGVRKPWRTLGRVSGGASMFDWPENWPEQYREN